MTTSYERTRSVIETSEFLAKISRDKFLPYHIREQARQLLRHYPTPKAVRLAGRCEAVRQDQISKLPGGPKALHPALATWPLLDPFFYDFTDQVALQPNDQTILATSPTLQPVPRREGNIVAAQFKMLELSSPHPQE